MILGEVGDKYEQEADRLAPQIASQINAPARAQSATPSAQTETTPLQALRPHLQLQSSGAGGSVTPAIAAAINQAQGQGRALDSGLQNRFSQAMGADFSQVRIHTDTQANQLSQSLSARAFTTGQDVFFNQGEYRPRSRSGQELIAHELTHVTQQQGTSIQRAYIQRDEIQEDESAMEALYKSKYKRIGSRRMFLTSDSAGKRLKIGDDNNPLTQKIDPHKKLQVLKSATDPHEELPAGEYYFIKFMEVGVDQSQADTLNINWVYGYAKKSDIEALGTYQNISAIGTSARNPKQGKILPEAATDPPISQADVYQSAISDCYLQAALIAIASSTPNAISRLFTRIDQDDLDITFPGTSDSAALKVTLQKKLFITPQG
jgi:hypothetical protein